MKKRFSLGISPCPNDTFIFHALLHKCVSLPFEIELVMADVEELNARACAGELDITKLSVGVVPKVIDTYALLQSGGALGWGCGPLIVSASCQMKHDVKAQKTARIAIPGRMTTANLLLELHGGFQGIREEMIFDKVIPAVAEKRVEAGVIIHEGRFTYAHYGLHKVLDLGAWWETTYSVPLPLGLIAVRRDVPYEIAFIMEEAIRDSIVYARTHPQASADFIHTHAQELSDSVTQAHINTFVNEYSLALGEEGRAAVELLVGKGAALQGGGVSSSLFLAS